jgi:hypothetical protein
MLWLPLTNFIICTPGQVFMAPAAGGRACPRVNLSLEKKDDAIHPPN